MRKGLALWLAAVAALPIAAGLAAADGLTVRYDTEDREWQVLQQTSQRAVINYDDGYEKLCISITVPYEDLNDSSSAVWVFPVPSSPEEVEIGVLSRFPFIDGYLLEDLAEYALAEDYVWIYSSQLYTIPFALTMVYTVKEPMYERITLAPEAGSGDSDEAVVWQHVEMMGLTTEVVTASTPTAFEDYMALHEMTLPSGSEEAVGEYIGSDYSFVVSWISDPSEFLESSSYLGSSYFSLGLALSFPTEDIYYPMKLTSALGDTDMQFLIEVIDWSTPVRPDGWADGYVLDHRHCVAPSFGVTSEQAWFFEEQLPDGVSGAFTLRDVNFTLVLMSGRASAFTEDLWFEEGSGSTRVMEFLRESSWMVTLPVFVAVSMSSAVLASWLTYRWYKPSFGRFAALGLANFLTIAGFALVCRRLDIERTLMEPSDDLGITSRLGKFVLVYSIAFIFLAGLTQGLMNLMI